jgi:ATP synthase protein I
MAFSLRPEDGEQARAIGVMASAGWAFAISVVLGLGGGVFLDRWLGTSPWLLFVGLALGFAAGVSNLVRATNAVSRRR